MLYYISIQSQLTFEQWSLVQAKTIFTIITVAHLGLRYEARLQYNIHTRNIDLHLICVIEIALVLALYNLQFTYHANASTNPLTPGTNTDSVYTTHWPSLPAVCSVYSSIASKSSSGPNHRLYPAVEGKRTPPARLAYHKPRRYGSLSSPGQSTSHGLE
jgi:hypothetical protein